MRQMDLGVAAQAGAVEPRARLRHLAQLEGGLQRVGGSGGVF